MATAPPTVLVVGGGFAGMAAAARLAARRIPVLLLEQRARLGGRAYSFHDPGSADTLDNGQHVLTGACGAALALFRLLGTERLLKFQRRLRIDYLDAAGPGGTLDCPPLPTPFHLLAGLLRLRALRPRDRLAALRVGLALRGAAADRSLDELTVEAWLDRLGQPEAARRLLWRPLALAILNETTERASALPLARTLAESFLGGRRQSVMILPGAGLSRLYEAALPDFLAARGGSVRTGARAVRIETEGGATERVAAVTLADGTRLPASRVIVAVPHQALPPLLPAALAAGEPFRSLSGLGAAPIVSIHLWLDREVTALPFVGLLGTEVQWVFNRNALADDVSGHLLTLVHSAAHAAAARPAAELAAAALEDLRRVLPAARAARVLRSRVVKERRATFAPLPGTDRLRPGPRTAVQGLLLAGDWTATGLPATIEGAVRSGNCAADVALEGETGVRT